MTSLSRTPTALLRVSRFTLVLALVSAANLGAHPVPDLPVRSHFHSDGSAEIRVEVDPRCFADDPEAEDYLQHDVAHKLSDAEFDKLKAKADIFVGQRLRFLFDPVGEVKPQFNWSFGKLGDGGIPFETDDVDLLKGTETVLVGSWKTTVVGGMTGYHIEALPMNPEKMGIALNVMFLNFIDGKQVERYAVLYPGESSFVLDLTGQKASPESAVRTPGSVGVDASSDDWWTLFFSEVKRGYVHVGATFGDIIRAFRDGTLPDGIDHILFVLGLFLMSRAWKPLLFQVSAFTVAHTLTLWLASAGAINLSANVVEPIIAASIVYVAVENIFHKRYTHWRLIVVFVFGLVHGLGFAGVMSTRLDSTASLIIGLLGINVGVELGQLAIIAFALLATFWIPAAHYRKFVVIPGSIIIALTGIWWVLDRTLLA